MDSLEALQRAVLDAERIYGIIRDDLQRQLDADGHQHLTPEQMRDPNGRFILLDALTAIVNARATQLWATQSLDRS